MMPVGHVRNVTIISSDKRVSTIESAFPMKVFHSNDGRFSFFHNETSGTAKLIEYEGYAPRLIIREIDLPFNELIGFVQAMFSSSAIPVLS